MKWMISDEKKLILLEGMWLFKITQPVLKKGKQTQYY